MRVPAAGLGGRGQCLPSLIQAKDSHNWSSGQSDCLRCGPRLGRGTTGSVGCNDAFVGASPALYRAIEECP
jgi:hypothetical protein